MTDCSESPPVRTPALVAKPFANLIALAWEFAFGASMLCAATRCEGQPLIYHFSVRVSEIEFDDAGLVSASGLQLGSSVEYTFAVDFGRPGTVTHYDGSVEVLQDDGGRGSFYSQFFVTV